MDGEWLEKKLKNKITRQNKKSMTVTQLVSEDHVSSWRNTAGLLLRHFFLVGIQILIIPNLIHTCDTGTTQNQSVCSPMMTFQLPS